MTSMLAHAGGVGGISLSSGSRYLVTGGADTVLKIWDLKQSRVVREITQHKSAITSVSHNSNDSLFASGGASGEIFVHNSTSGQLVVPFTAPNFEVRHIASQV